MDTFRIKLKLALNLFRLKTIYEIFYAFLISKIYKQTNTLFCKFEYFIQSA